MFIDVGPFIQFCFIYLLYILFIIYIGLNVSELIYSFTFLFLKMVTLAQTTHHKVSSLNSAGARDALAWIGSGPLAKKVHGSRAFLNWRIDSADDHFT